MNRIVVFNILVSLASVLHGQTEKMVNPADLKQQTIITEPLSLRKGFLRVGLTYDYSVLDKYFTEEGKKEYFPETAWASRSEISFWGQYGITDRLMVEIGVPYAMDLVNFHTRTEAPSWDTTVVFNSSVTGRGLGDLRVSGTYQIIPSEGHKFDIKADFDITFPTGEKNPTSIDESGNYDEPTGEGVFVINPRLTARYVSYPLSFISYISYDYNFWGSKKMSPWDQTETKFKYGNLFTVGGSFNFHLNEWIALTNELKYSHWEEGEVESGSTAEFPESWAFSYQPRLVFQIKRFRLGEAVDIPLKGKIVGADPTYVLIAQYVF
jgi:hypothetical protein